MGPACGISYREVSREIDAGSGIRRTPALHQEPAMSDYRDDVVLTVLCPSCGEVDLSADQVWLVVASVADRSHYRFTCAGCDRSVRRPADETVVALLSELVAVEEFEIPAEALETHDGPPLTSDDLLDLVLALEQHTAVGSTVAR
jgi:hypothetical protein